MNRARLDALAAAATRLAATSAISFAAIAITASPAGAHTVTGVQPTNYRSEILAITPADHDLDVELLDLGKRVRVTNTGHDDVVVLGYQSEPYLRIGPQGVYENEHSPSVPLNQVGATSTTSTTSPQQHISEPPSWHKTSNGTTATWRDRRTRWEGPAPQTVNADTSRAHLVGQWAIELRRGQQAVTVTGRIVWKPPPSATPWLLGAFALTIVTASVGLLRRWGTPMSAVVAVLVATDVVHTIGDSSTAGKDAVAVIVRVLVGGLITTVAWIAGVWAVPALQRQREAGLIAAGFAALVVFLYSGIGDISSLGRSQLAYAWAPVSARVAVMVALGAGLGTLGAVGIAFKRTPPNRR